MSKILNIFMVVFFFCCVAYAGVDPSNKFKLGDGTVSNKTIQANTGLGANDPLLEYVSASSRWKQCLGGVCSPIGSASILSENAQSGTMYTFALSDIGGIVGFSNAANISAIVPQNSSVAFPVGSLINVVQKGAGTVAVTPGPGVTVNALSGNLGSSGQYARMQLFKQATDSWYVFGDLAPVILITATGGSISTDGDYKVHTFTSSGTFQITAGSAAIDSLVVAGGGGGDVTAGPGGGGAGGLVYTSPGAVLGVGSYTVTVGAGGTGGVGAGTGGNGGNSQFNLMTAAVGGGGGGDGSTSGNAGGSGGGAGRGGTGGTATAGQGNNGGLGNVGSNDSGGGGGGCGAVGGNAASAVGGNGGTGCMNSITGAPVCYAGGGAGGVSPNGSGTAGTATCGGGNGSTAGAATAGTANTGGGGGGSGDPTPGVGAAGGSGIVIVRYKFQ